MYNEEKTQSIVWVASVYLSVVWRHVLICVAIKVFDFFEWVVLLCNILELTSRGTIISVF